MVLTTTRDHGHLLKGTDQWCRLPGVDDRGVGPFHSVDQASGRCGDAAELAEKVQGYPLTGQDRSCRTSHGREARTGLYDISIRREGADREIVVDQFEYA